MKILSTFLLLVAAAPLYAQNGSQICGIYFDHDAVGNRIKRSYDCRSLEPDSNDPPETTSRGSGKGDSTKPSGMARKAPNAGKNRTHTDAPEAGAAAITVYPNPTPGVFTIKLPAPPATPLHFHWYDEQHRILSAGTITGQFHTGDISAWADGVYLLQIYREGHTQSYKVVKNSGSNQ